MKFGLVIRTTEFNLSQTGKNIIHFPALCHREIKLGSFWKYKYIAVYHAMLLMSMGSVLHQLPRNL